MNPDIKSTISGLVLAYFFIILKIISVYIISSSFLVIELKFGQIIRPMALSENLASILRQSQFRIMLVEIIFRLAELETQIQVLERLQNEG